MLHTVKELTGDRIAATDGEMGAKENFRKSRGVVVTHSAASASEHERATHRTIARMLAGLKGFEFGGDYDAAAHYGGPLYFVPSDTLLERAARALGIRSRDDLFGGVVPFPFVATKSIVHPLVAVDAQAPSGWSPEFAKRVRGAVLPGFAAFSLRDARCAGLRLLQQGPIRLKPGQAVGGHGQAVVADASQLQARLEELDAAALERYGLSIELNLTDVTTYSIGQVWVGRLEASYCGTQKLALDNSCGAAYGGSDLLVARGDADALAALPLAPEIRLAIGQAQAFDAATEQFGGMFASRRNYDAVRGRDRRGRWRTGILEQSWRIGGASGPEVAALAALRADPALRAVRAHSTEMYGGAAAPPGAIVQFSGMDSRVGPLTKYTIVEPHASAG